MYPITFLISYLLLVFCYFGAAEPPPAHGYGPPSPVEFNSNEVSSHEQYTSPVDFGNYGSFSSGSSGYTAPNTNYAKSGPSFAPHFSSGSSGSGFPSYKSGNGKGGVSSSYISIVHGPGGAASPSKQRPVTYSSSSKGQAAAAAPYKSQHFASSAFNEAPNAFASGEISNYFGKGFGSGSSSQYNAGGYDFPSNANSNSGYKQNADYEGGASDEVGSYSSGGPSYATFTGSKPSFNPATFNSHSGSRGNAYSTSNIHFSGGKVSGHGGHGNFHPPAFTGSFKPSGTKVYNRYSSPNGGYQVSGASSSTFGAAPLVGSETGYNSRALKAGYTAEGGSNAKNQDEVSGEDVANFFAGFGDGTGFKVQSSYSTG